MDLNQLNDFQKFVEDLERNGMMRQCLEEVDKERLKEKTWNFALQKHVFTKLENYENKVTFISVRLGKRFGGDPIDMKVENTTEIKAEKGKEKSEVETVEDVSFPLPTDEAEQAVNEGKVAVSVDQVVAATAQEPPQKAKVGPPQKQDFDGAAMCGCCVIF